MGKTTKRSRKFSSKGGVKAALSKGTITKKGRLTTKAKRRAEPKRNEAADGVAKKTTTTTKTSTKRDDDFLSESHLKDLNVEEFFQAVVEDASKERTGDDGNDDDDDDEKTEIDEQNEAEEEEEEEKNLVASDEEDEKDLDAAEERMKNRLEKLRTEDPEFHKYLKENDQSLLEFGEDDGEEEDDDDDQSSENEHASNETKHTNDDKDDKDDSAVELSPARVDGMERGAFVDFSLRSLKRVVLAYRTACHLSDADADGGNALYRIDSSEMFDRIVVLALTRCHEAFRRHALLDDDDEDNDDKNKDDNKNKDDTPIPPNRLTKSPKWSELSKVIKSFFKSTQHLLNEISEPKLCTFVLRCLSKYLPFLSAFDVPLLAKPLLKTLVSKWSAPFRSEDDHVARLHAFLRVRQAALVLPYPFLDDCLKSSYLAYARVARFAADDGGVATLTFMGNCLVELYGLDKDSSYQHAFVYVRQLALHLRTAVRKSDAATTSKVLCEQYVRCLELWAAVIAADDDTKSNGNDDDVVASTRSLAYPLVEIVVGMARLSPNVRWLPLRLRCVRLLQRLAASTHTFIPTTPFLLEALELKELRAKVRNPRPTTTTTTFRLESTLRLPKEDPLGTWERRDACMSEVLFLLSQEMDLYRYSVAFPEFSTRVVRKLRRFLKDPDCCGRHGGGRWRVLARACVEACEERAAFARRARANAVDAPKDVRELEALRPASAPDMAARYFRAESARRRGQRRGNDDDAATTKRRTTNTTPNHENENNEQNLTRTKKRKVATAKKKKPAPNEADLANTKSLVEDDVVKEGIDWSDEEEEDDDE